MNRMKLLLYIWLRGITDPGTFSFRWIKPFWYFCLQKRYKASLALYRFCCQKYQKGFKYRKLEVPTSEREGKRSNPHNTGHLLMLHHKGTASQDPRTKNAVTFSIFMFRIIRSWCLSHFHVLCGIARRVFNSRPFLGPGGHFGKVIILSDLCGRPGRRFLGEMTTPRRLENPYCSS